MSEKKRKAAVDSSRKNKTKFKQFCYGVPLDQLPCTYFPDYGNVVTFLVEAAEIIRQHVDVEGLFCKSADLRRQDELKMLVERGQGLQGDVDVHEVTGLVRTFFRLLPEPLLPCLFHDAFMASIDLPEVTGQRTEAIQGLCFTLPASHLSCLRYFMKLLHHITRHAHKNRMNAQNLAIVLTPSLIRLKVRAKLMTPEELRVLPKQTLLIEHLIYHAEGIGCMPSKLYQHTIQMTEELFHKQLNPKKNKKGKCCTDLAWLGAAQTVLSMVAALHFRPNSSAAVSDSDMVDGPYRQTARAWLHHPDSHNAREAGNNTKEPLNKTCSGRCRQRHKMRMQIKTRRRSAAMGRSNCKAMQEPLIQSWSTAISFSPYSSSSDSDLEICYSEDSGWSDKDADYSNSDEEKTMSDAAEQILGEHPFLANSRNSSFTTEYRLGSETLAGDDRMLLNEHIFLARSTHSTLNTTYSSSSETIIASDTMLPTNQKKTEETQKEECNLASREFTYNAESGYSDTHTLLYELMCSDGHTLVSDFKADCCSIFTEESNSTAGKEDNFNQTTVVTDINCLPSVKSLKMKTTDMNQETCDQIVQPFDDQVKENLDQQDNEILWKKGVIHNLSAHLSDSEIQQGCINFTGNKSSKLNTDDVIQETCDQSLHPSEDQVKECLNQQENDTNQKAEIIPNLYEHWAELETQQYCKTGSTELGKEHPKNEQTTISFNASRTEDMTTMSNMNTIFSSLADHETNSQVIQECMKDGSHSGTLHQYSQSADAEKKTRSPCSKSAVADSGKLNRHSQSAGAGDGILNKQSQSAVSDCGILNQHSQSVAGDSGLFNQHSQNVAAQHSQSVAADGGHLFQRSHTVFTGCAVLSKKSQCLVGDNRLLNQHSQSVVDEDGKLILHLQNVVAYGEILKQHPQSVLGDSGILNQQSQGVVADGTQNQHSKSAVHDSGSLNQHSQSAVADGGKANQHLQVGEDNGMLNQHSQSVVAGILHPHSQSLVADGGISISDSQSAFGDIGILNHMLLKLVPDDQILNQQSQSVLANGILNKHSQTVVTSRGILKEPSESVFADGEILNMPSQSTAANGGIENEHSQNVVDSGIVNEHSQGVAADNGIVKEHSQSVAADNGIVNEHSQSVVAHTEMLQQSDSKNDQQLLFHSRLMSTFLQQYTAVSSSSKGIPALPVTKPESRLKKHLHQLAQRYQSLEEKSCRHQTA